jgi:YesN/AraC family two-component response regulator
MVCSRCILAVQNILKGLDIPGSSVQLGEVQLADDIPAEKLTSLSKELNAIGFELINDKRGRLIEKIKNIIIEIVHRSTEQPKIKFSAYLEEKLQYDYNYLSNLFSEIEGTTIEKYYIAQKIEKVKELLVYDEKSLSEISFQLGYSGVAYLSNQFKKVTGLSPSHFKKIKTGKRKPLDKV